MSGYHVPNTARFLSVALLAAGLAGCSPGPAPTQAKPLSLKATYDHLRNCHQRRAYLAMQPYIDPMHAQDVVDLLVAVDELLAANASVQQAIRGACPGLAPERFDLATVADCLDIFSRSVEYASEQISGDKGIVRVQIGGRLPLCELHFRRQGDCWVYEPGPTTAELIPVIREIATALERIRIVHPKTPADISDEYRLRVGPKLHRIARIAGSQPA